MSAWECLREFRPGLERKRMFKRKRILVAVDGSPHSMSAVEYAAGLCAGRRVELSLFCVLQMASDELLWHINVDEDCKRLLKEKYERFNEECRGEAHGFLQLAREAAIGLGVGPDLVAANLQQWRAGVARDIIAEAGMGYDAVVVGRRGVGGMEAMLLGSVSTKVVQGVDRTPVWVVGGRPHSRKMLIAVDSSENSLKAVQYAAAFAAECGCEVSLCHVVRRFFPALTPSSVAPAGEAVEEELNEGMKEKVQEIFAACRTRLLDAGVHAGRISLICRRGSYSRAAEILDVAAEGDYGTIVLGRRGISSVREFLLGRVTNKVLNGAENVAVWIVP